MNRWKASKDIYTLLRIWTTSQPHRGAKFDLGLIIPYVAMVLRTFLGGQLVPACTKTGDGEIMDTVWDGKLEKLIFISPERMMRPQEPSASISCKQRWETREIRLGCGIGESGVPYWRRGPAGGTSGNVRSSRLHSGSDLQFSDRWQINQAFHSRRRMGFGLDLCIWVRVP